MNRVLEIGYKDFSNVLVVINGKVAKPGQPLYSSDRVVVLPLMSGG